MLTDIKTLMDIQDFQIALSTAFKEKGALTTFKNLVVKQANKRYPQTKQVLKKKQRKILLKI